MRTLDEVKTKVEADIADPIESVMVALCSGIHPLELFHPDFYKPEYKDDALAITKENVISEMREYINFAMGKAIDQRGISANRSIWKFKQWLWLLEDDEITNFDFNDYGYKLLFKIAKKYDLTINEE
ncbi:hypothetical protein KAT92_06325 [Candidatus Babeliales bacterium]|nr:hypothetical protein [Candidatus Babeliales bacterium]